MRTVKCVSAFLSVSTQSVLPPLQPQHLWSGCLTRSDRRPSGLRSGLRSHRRVHALRQGQAVRLADQTRAATITGHGDDGRRRYGQIRWHVFGVRLRPDHRQHPRHQSRNHRLLQVSWGVRSEERKVRWEECVVEKLWQRPTLPVGFCYSAKLLVHYAPVVMNYRFWVGDKGCHSAWFSLTINVLTIVYTKSSFVYYLIDLCVFLVEQKVKSTSNWGHVRPVPLPVVRVLEICRTSH